MSNVLTRIYRPSKMVGQLYARVYGSAKALTPVGNVLELLLEHKEDVQKQSDMTALGGGTHSEDRQVTEVTMKMKMADLNAVNLCRAVLGTAALVPAADVVGEQFTAYLGGLLPLAHIQPTDVVLKTGADKASATPVAAANNFEVRPEGIFLLPTATDIAEDAKLWISYSHGEYANIEALTTKAVELELVFGGLNSVDNGNPQRVELFRVSQSVTKTLALINKDFGSLEVEGSVLLDPTKTGVGTSRYYRTSFV